MSLYKRSHAKQYARQNFKGVWAAVPTPFDAKGELDERAIRSDIRFFIDVLKLDGIFFGGLVAEFWALTMEERLRLQEITLDEVGGAMGTIAHTACMSTRDTVRLTQHAQEHGATYAVCANPPMNPEAPEHTIAWFNAVCSETDLGISLFNNAISGYVLSPETIAELGQIENIIGVKNARPLDHTIKTRQLAGDAIIIFDADEGRLCENILTYGDQVFMASPSPILLQREGYLPIRDYAHKAWAGQAEEARRISASLQPARDVMNKWAMRNHMIEQNSAEIKYWAGLLGQSGGLPRPPLSPMKADRQQALYSELQRVGLVQPNKMAA
jgi:4-hydroxy-tetrahydrodipicolinate synthase